MRARDLKSSSAGGNFVFVVVAFCCLSERACAIMAMGGKNAFAAMVVGYEQCFV